MTLTTEQLLVSPQAFGLTTASPLQRAICRAVDGLPLGDLALREDVREAIGDVDALPVGKPPHEVHILAAIRTAKSLLSAATTIRASQTVDVSGLARGDIIRIGVVSLKLENTRAVMNHLVSNLRAKPLLRPLLVGDPEAASESGVELRHPSGRIVEVVPVPLDRAGGSVTSVWLALLIVDEEPRMVGASDGVKNWDHVRDAAAGRFLDGAQFLGIGSPHAPFGPIYNLVQENWGRPTRDLVIIRAKGPQMNPGLWTPEKCDDLRRRNPTAYRTDVLCEFAEPEEALLSAVEIDAVTRSAPEVLPATTDARYVAAMDPATRGNSWGLVIVELGPVRRVVLARQWTSSRAEPLDPERALNEIAHACAPYTTTAYTDQFAIDFVHKMASKVGLHTIEHTVTGTNKFELMQNLATTIAAKEVELPPSLVLRGDLLGLKRRVTQAGVQIVSAKTRDGRHGDLASALALALLVAGRSRTHVPFYGVACGARDAYGDGDADEFMTPRGTLVPGAPHNNW